MAPRKRLSAKERGVTDQPGWLTPQTLFSLIGTVTGCLSLYFTWQNRKELRAKEALRAGLEIEEEPLAKYPSPWHLGHLRFRNPLDLPIRIVAVRLVRPPEGVLVNVVEPTASHYHPVLSISRTDSHAEFDVPPSSTSDEVGWTTEILLLAGSEDRSISHATVSIRITYHLISDKRHNRTIDVTSNPVTLTPMRASKIKLSPNVGSPPTT